ncbi:hypothetical protein UFOVP660_7 [uncultured Caudovirales phage]|uniref:Uncharacterized protein n=1 Tax=uncultured Caudovirales phage TaxID=2100421 RepID=A0A6J5ND28_9CAUD|nr:hypothetical protein UFOVP660_7 [uncultured Caudovirales phage]
MITDIKNSIKDILQEHVENVFTYSPARPTAPCAIVEANSPFISVNDDEYDAIYSTNWKILVMVQTAQNDLETTILDNLIDALVPSLWANQAVSKLDVDRPFLTEANAATYLSTNINITIDSQGGN